MRTLGCEPSPPLPPKINAPQHDPRRRTLELRRLILPFHAGFDALAQAGELGFALGGPLLAFALLGTIATIIIVFIYILTNLSNLIYFARDQRAELNPIWNVAVPVVGVLIFIPVLLAAFGIDFGGLGIAPLTAPANAAPWVVVAWIVLGVVVFALYRVRFPGRIEETAKVFIEGEA